MEKQTAQFYVLVLNVYVVGFLQEMVTFDSFQSALRFAGMKVCALYSSSFQHTSV